MNNEPSQLSGPPASVRDEIKNEDAGAKAGSAQQIHQQLAAEPAKGQTKVSKATDTALEDGRSDSEAETVVMPGKEEHASSVPKRSIKHEASSRVKPSSDTKHDDHTRVVKERNAANDDKNKKQNTLTETNNSSNLSSTRSTPDRDPNHRPLSRAESESTQSRSKISHDSDAHSRSSVPRKRKVSADEAEEKLQRRRVKRERQSEERAVTDLRKGSNPRSTSPTRQRPRALSTQSSNPGSTQKRRKPPPLIVSSKRRASDDSESNESGSPRPSAHPKRSAALEDASMPKTHRKLRDKNGRTQLARACAVEDVDSVIARLKDRPEDIDAEDNAGNTPLQIAALEGNDDIVKVLLDHSCKTDCMNLDKDTPLIDAVENGHLEVVRLLLKAGVNPRQVNAKGEEPIDLIDLEGDHGKEIKTALEKARDRYDRRRQSEDIKIPNTARESVAGRSPRESPSLQSARSPPPPTSRRRPARSEPSRNDLLWLNPTPERLREKAGMGDDEAVLHILEMKPMADAEAVLAAAKGGHELCLSFLFAIGKANPDPEPLRGAKESLSTPMLCAVGRDNMGVLKLILDQPGFDPTRRTYKKLTYYELARERRGVGWEDEYKLLKSAFERHKERGGGRSPNSVHKSPQHREGKKGVREKTSTSPLRAPQKSTSPTLTAKDALVRKKSVVEVRNGHARKEREREGSDRASEGSKKHLKVPRQESREGSNAISDREASPLRPSNGDKKRSMSDAEKDAPKPRKRLVSGKDLKNDQDRKRRNSLISTASSASAQDHVRTPSTKEQGLLKSKHDEKSDLKGEGATAKKRARRSDTPPTRASADPTKQSELKKTKRPRVNSDSSLANKASKASAPAGPARVANMAAPATSSGSAPVAFMGSSTALAGKDSKASPTTQPPISSPVLSSKGKSPPNAKSSLEETRTILDQDVKPDKKLEEGPNPQQEIKMEDAVDDGTTMPQTLNNDKQDPDIVMTDENGKVEEPAPETTQREADEEAKRLEAEREKAEAERLERQRQEEAALAKRKQEEEEEAKRLEEQRKAEEEAAILRKKQEEEEEAARIQREKEAEEKAAEQRRKQAEEEEAARLKRKREEQEELARLKKRREEEQERQRLRRLEEEERRRRDQLPKALCVSADLGLAAKEFHEVSYWLPLWTVKGSQLEPTCAEAAREELWVTNVQVAPLLGLTDLDLSQYTGWSKHELSSVQRFAVWRVLRLLLTRHEVHPLDYRLEDELAAESVAKSKFDALAHVFWVRLADLLDIVPRYSHLAGVNLRHRPMALTHKNDSRWGSDGAFDNGVPDSIQSRLFSGPEGAQSAALTNGQSHHNGNIEVQLTNGTRIAFSAE